MKAYEKGNKQIKTAFGIVQKEVRILFPLAYGGDVILEEGDKIEIKVFRK